MRLPIMSVVSGSAVAALAGCAGSIGVCDVGAEVMDVQSAQHPAFDWWGGVGTRVTQRLMQRLLQMTKLRSRARVLRVY